MKVKGIMTMSLSVADLPRAERFYHEVFDLPEIANQSGEDVKTLRCGGQILKLVPLKEEQNFIPQEITLMLGDNMEDITNHFLNYFVEIIDQPQKFKTLAGEALMTTIADPDGNLIHVCTLSDR